jgi:pSer/pThr/pTyr-binding forkhead associated (FHA) protein
MTEAEPITAGSDKLLRRARESRRHSLEQIDGGGFPRQIILQAGESVMGRAAGAHVHLDSKSASRHHAFLRVRGTDCILCDNDSRNGIFLNGVKIHAAVLRDGDVIQAAGSTFIYYEG